MADDENQQDPIRKNAIKKSNEFKDAEAGLKDNPWRNDSQPVSERRNQPVPRRRKAPRKNQ